jgi:Fuc2NAc and GlcNAc transferase
VTLSVHLLGMLLVISALATSALLTQFVRSIAAASGALDVPNARSSHGVPTPRGGGIAIVLVTTAGLLILTLHGTVRWDLAAAVAGGGLAVALVGFADDRRSLRAATRLTVHFAAALWALAWLGGLPALRVGTHVVSLGWSGYLLGAFGIVWAINLFNFMDGIDGIAAVEAIFVALGGALLSVPMAAGTGVGLSALVLAAACAGFLLWNWPPAKIFLGDVGSGYLGYVIVVLALAATRDNPIGLWLWLILGGAFFVDATVTLVRRALRNERLQEAHRSHAYQWLARRWQSHAKVTLAALGLNVLWLFPCAAFAVRHPQFAAIAMIFALAPLALLAIIAGAGQRETNLQKPSA